MDPVESHFHPRDQEGAKFAINSPELSVERGDPLPDSYGDNRLVVLARDPFWFFTYWEITPDRIQEVRHQYGADVWEKSQVILRVYDTTSNGGNGGAAHRFFDIPVTLEARQWYVQVPESGRTYQVEFGLRLPDGRFISLLQSNRITLPGGRVSDQTDAEWLAVNASEWEQMLQAHGTRSRAQGSAEAAKEMAQRWEFLRSVFSVSSSRLSSRGNP